MKAINIWEFVSLSNFSFDISPIHRCFNPAQGPLPSLAVDSLLDLMYPRCGASACTSPATYVDPDFDGKACRPFTFPAADESGEYCFNTSAPLASNFRAKPICTEEILYGADLCTWRAKCGDNLALIAPVNPKIVFVHRPDPACVRYLSHPNDARIRQAAHGTVHRGLQVHQGRSTPSRSNPKIAPASLRGSGVSSWATASPRWLTT